MAEPAKKDPFIVKCFPPSLETSTDPTPYMLIKIFETKTGTVVSDDPTSKSIRTGAERAYKAYDIATGGSTTLQGVAVGATVGGLGGAVAGAAVGMFANLTKDVTNTTLDNIFNTVNVDYVGQAKEQIKNFSLKRNQDMQAAMLALFMPEGMSASYDQDYEGISVTQSLGMLGFLAQAAGSRAPGSDASPSKTQSYNPFIAEAAGAAGSKLIGGDITKLTQFATTGTVVNPQIELLYTSPTLRKFTFDFRFVPRNKTEADILFGKQQPSDNTEQINIPDLGLINMLKYFSAPRIVDNTGGRYFVPPAQFMLEFWYNDPTSQKRINKNLFKTKRCVLESINLDYGPNGFATHYDGVPVEVRMQLTFQETVMLDRDAIKAGY